MLDIKFLKENVPNLGDMIFSDIERLRVLTEQEVKKLLNEADNLDVVEATNLCLTALCYMQQPKIRSNEEIFREYFGTRKQKDIEKDTGVEYLNNTPTSSTRNK